MEFDLMSAAMGFLIGAFTGAAGTYLGNLFTDQRRKQELAKAETTEFREIAKRMPDLIAEMQADLNGNSDTRDFFVLGSRREILGGTSTPAFQYYEEEHPFLMGKLRTLENKGYIRDISPGDTPKYTMIEAFVSQVLTYRQ